MSHSDFDEFVIMANPESPRGFNVYLPRPISSRFLEFAATRIAKLRYFSQTSMHLLAVANSGVPLATAVLMYRRQHRFPGYKDDVLSIVDPYRHNFLIGDEVKAKVQVVIDNSIKSVKTLNLVRHQMEAEHLPRARYVLKLVDYQDLYEQELLEHLSDMNMETISVFGLDEIIDEMSKTKREIAEMLLQSKSYERYT